MKHIRCAFIGLVLFPGVQQSFAQPIHLGLKIGMRTTDVLAGQTLTETFPTFQSEYRLSDESRRFTFGPAANIALGARTSVEVGLVYRSLGISEAVHVFDTGAPDPFFDLRLTRRISSRSLEFPVLLKRLFLYRPTRPFAGVGYVYRRLFDMVPAVDDTPFPVGSPGFMHRATHGLVLSGGLQFAKGRFRIAPELRYTRWNQKLVRIENASEVSKLNQIDLLLGIEF